MHIPKPTDAEFELAPAGTHLAVCYRVIDLGTQTGSYMGKPKSQHKILVAWELPDEKMKDGRPFSIMQRYTWSMSEKARLRKDLESWRGVPFTDPDFGTFDIKNVLGKGCLLNVIHAESGDKTYANIASISKMMKGQVAPEPTNEKLYLWIHPSRWDAATFAKLSPGMQTTITQSPEYAELANGEHDIPERDDMEQEIPF